MKSLMQYLLRLFCSVATSRERFFYERSWVHFGHRRGNSAVPGKPVSKTSFRVRSRGSATSSVPPSSIAVADSADFVADGG
jgi:hypothetical protein